VGGAPPRTISRDDVTELPAGAATGMDFSGTYRFVESTVTGCYCRLGSCNGLMGQLGTIATVDQKDGVFALVGSDGVPCTGGIDADGRHWCGLAWEQSDVTEYLLIEGRIDRAAGLPFEGHETEEITIRQNGNGVIVDCDIRAAATLRFEDG
jgi:hypothetical protein